MTRGPPCSTLLPYSTLFRSRLGDGVGPRRPRFLIADLLQDHVRLRDGLALEEDFAADRVSRLAVVACDAFLGRLDPRSEEYTSELQSRQYLVCCLLLENKKR